MLGFLFLRVSEDSKAARIKARLENIVVSRAAKAASDTLYFLRALREKQLSTVFPSLTLKVHGFALHGLEAARSFARKESRKNANEEHRQTRKNTKRL